MTAGCSPSWPSTSRRRSPRSSRPPAPPCRPTPTRPDSAAASSRLSAARRLTRRSHRAEDRRFLAEGPQAVREALRTDPGLPGSVLEVFVAADASDRLGDLGARAEAQGLPVHLVSPERLAPLTDTVAPQGVVAVCSWLARPAAALAQVLGAAGGLVVILAAVRDPGNAGTVVRVGDAAGAGAVVLTETSVDAHNSKCVRASAGSLWHLPVVADVEAEAAVQGARDAGLRVLAADVTGRRDLDALDDAGDLRAPTAWLFGNEAWGLPPRTRALADEVVRIPMHGQAESLNLGTAAAVCLYASARARRHRG